MLCLFSGRGWQIRPERGMSLRMPMHRFPGSRFGMPPSMAQRRAMLLEFVSFSHFMFAIHFARFVFFWYRLQGASTETASYIVFITHSLVAAMFWSTLKAWISRFNFFL